MQAAASAVDQQLAHPTPPARLSLCQAGSAASLIPDKSGRLVWWCPPPPEVLASMQNEQLQDQVVTLSGALSKEVDLRFQLLDWAFGKGSAPASAPP